jgi:hypothetical protein
MERAERRIRFTENTQPVLACARILVGGDGLEPPTSCV